VISVATITPTNVVKEVYRGKKMTINPFIDFTRIPMPKRRGIEIIEPMPWWLGRLDLNLFEDRRGVITGTVKVLGVLQVKSRVNLYYRKSGQLIQSTFTDADGVFLFKCGLNRNVADYYAVAITEQPFNAQIFDKLTPA
jgi:hypothetical protein